MPGSSITVPGKESTDPARRRASPGDGPVLLGLCHARRTIATVRDATTSGQVVSGPGLPNLTRHRLRHTGAALVAGAGIPLHVLQGALGHASIETTCGDLRPADLGSAAEQANTFLAGSAKASGPTRRCVAVPLIASRGCVRALWSPFGPLIRRRRPTEDRTRRLESQGVYPSRQEGTRGGPPKTRRQT